MLKHEGTFKTSALPVALGVTPMTIWRDLTLLEEQGLVQRGRGVVRLATSEQREPDFESKELSFSEAKRHIAGKAVREFVREGDVIALEGGSTVAALVQALPEERISVVTNSLPIALRLRNQRPALPVRVVGGWLSPVSGNSTGPEALREIKGLSVDVCFLSATAWDETKGPMDPNPLEIEVKRALAAVANRVVVMMDSGKFSLRSRSVMLHPRRLHALVTDIPPPPKVQELLNRHQVKVVLCNEP